MDTVRIKKRQTLKHNGVMVIDANFISANESFSKPFTFPINATEEEILNEIKCWIEKKEDSDATSPFPEMTEVDLSTITTDWKEREDYEKSKAELEELAELVALGAMDANDQKIKDKQTEVKNKYKDGYKKEN